MESLLFFWFSWILWVLISFFYEKSLARFYLAAAVLVGMIVYPLSWSGESYTVPFAFGVALITAIVWAGNVPKKRWLALIVCALSLMFMYAAIELAYWFSPVIFYAHDVWVPAAAIFFLTVFVYRYRDSRYPLAMLALCFGELLTGWVLVPLREGLFIADALFFNRLTAVLVLFVVWHMIESLVQRAGQYQHHSRRKKVTLSA
ncbi:hypothetical protein JCM19037_633 [Geomicrobium sp. JCM 19037]|uniref:YphA family membrane protein n=1 Tax=Geomicrobium sp. JCM 19037 TaxID=1460634 RepID=UPI00045F1AD3|nr:hypothetical protein [Geomicrobium sp. JCM 19037]GAK02402.1 hypothetical protein JCM19037_633 [Geomicrobium sp. JCM 19037]